MHVAFIFLYLKTKTEIITHSVALNISNTGISNYPLCQGKQFRLISYFLTFPLQLPKQFISPSKFSGIRKGASVNKARFVTQPNLPITPHN